MSEMGGVTGVILAGGESKRMGRDKAFVEYRERRLIDWAYRAFETWCDQILISSNAPAEQFDFAPVIADRFKGIGPIAGLESGLFHSHHSRLVFLSCDTPNISASLLRYLLENHGDAQVSLAAHQGINQPMVGVYEKSCHSAFLNAIEKGLYKPPHVIRSLRWQEIDIHSGLSFYSPELFLNLNRPEDLN